MGTTKYNLYNACCKALKYKPCTLKQFSFLPSNQRMSLFAEHRMIVIIEKENMLNGKKWKINWLDWSQTKWRNWYRSVKDSKKSSGVGFVFRDASDGVVFDRSYLGSRLHFRTQEIGERLANNSEFMQAVEEYIK